jgi:hypothetical protein
MSRKLTLERCDRAAADRGGQCLSVGYENTKTKMFWGCEFGHLWETPVANILSGTWCPWCSGNLHGRTAAWYQKLAALRGGRCLATSYVGTNVLVKWACGNGHVWEAQACALQTQNRWCPWCSGNKNNRTASWYQELAEKRGGKTEALKYVGTNVPVPWMCSRGHKWTAQACAIQAGVWCRECSGSAKHDLSWCQGEAERRGGKCLSEKYENALAKMRWQCKYGHVWEARPNSVISRGQWCPHCCRHVSRPEEELFKIIKYLYEDAQSRVRIPNHRRFELDIFIPSKNKAIEYDGLFWHHSVWAASHGAHERDAKKNAACQKEGIGLMRIQELELAEDPKGTLGRIMTWLNE